MKLRIHSLNFSFSDNDIEKYSVQLDKISTYIKTLRTKAGIENEKFIKTSIKLKSAIEKGEDLSSVIDSPIMIRALAVSLQSDLQDKIIIDSSVIDKLNNIRPKPSSLLIENMYQYYLSKYDQISDPGVIASWLLSSLAIKGRLKSFHKELLSANGPKWLAQQCIVNNREFSNQLQYVDLHNYSSGRFLTIAKGIYYVEQLKSIPVNKPHDLLQEIQNKSTYDSRYDEDYLLGHKILQILINRAPDKGIHDSWLNAILAIAGDPRVPKSHQKYIKWWSQIEPSLNLKVRGWLSRLDLRLFLEALKNYSYQSGNDELRRMFPSRKNFLEGLEKRDLITDTRLYLSYGAIQYLKKNYNAEHLPKYSMVTDGDKSIIHVRLGDSHLIEGSHSCYLWVYEKLDPSAVVFDYSKIKVSYYALTQGLNYAMELKGAPCYDNITHNPTNFNWQHKAISSLNDIGVDIKAKDVLSADDYRKYIRRYGAG
ncbi:MAG: EH signature domain-containing protein [Pseudomonadota bacterium]